MRLLFVSVLLLGPGFLTAAQHTGSVRAADQFIPGATVTARNGAAKVVGYTDETGRYAIDLAPGVWDIQVEMFGFAPLRSQITMGLDPVNKDWTIEMPRPGAPTAASPAADGKAVPAKSTAVDSQTAATPAGDQAAKPGTAAATPRNTDRAAGQGGNRQRGQFGQGRGANGQGGRGANTAQAGARTARSGIPKHVRDCYRRRRTGAGLDRNRSASRPERGRRYRRFIPGQRQHERRARSGYR
jgi:hypothetical protein